MKPPAAMPGAFAFDADALPPTIQTMPLPIKRTVLTLAILLSFSMFHLTGRLAGIPAYAGDSASLLQNPSPILAWLGLIVTLFASLAVCRVIVRRVNDVAPPAAALAGLTALSWRGDRMFFTLTQAGSRGVYIQLIVELLLLGVLAMAAVRFFTLVAVADPKVPDPVAADEEEPLSQKLLGIVASVLAGGVVMLVLCQSDAKAQVLFSVAVASLAGAWFAHRFVPNPWPIFYVAGPVLVGIVGYAAAFFSPLGLDIGEARNGLGALARPLPLDYIAAGVPAALYGFSIRRGSYHEERREKAANRVAAPTVPTPVPTPG